MLLVIVDSKGCHGLIWVKVEGVVGYQHTAIPEHLSQTLTGIS